MQPIRLVIFDCDGVLIDTEPVSNAVLKRRLDAIGMPMSLDEVIHAFIGRSKGDCLAMIAERAGGPLPASFEAEWDREFDAALRDETRAIEGVAELLRDLPLPYCVASNGEPDRMRVALEAAGLLALVDGPSARSLGGRRLFTASEVARPKPAPDLFLPAARMMGAAPSTSVVVEDTPTGVRAAVAAKMRVFAYAGAGHAQPDVLEREGAVVFREMGELRELLGLR